MNRPVPKWDPSDGCPWWSADKLHELLIERGLTYREAGRELGCHARTVKKWARRHGLLDDG